MRKEMNSASVLIVAALLLCFGGSIARSDEFDYLSEEMNLSAGQWLLRVEYPGHELPHIRTELRSNGEFRKFSDQAGKGNWKEVRLSHTTADDASSAYQAAAAVVNGFDLKNRARPDAGRDDDAVTQVTLATADGAAQVWFRGSEENRDEKLSKTIVNLEATLAAIRKKDAAVEKAEQAKKTQTPRWCVVVEDSTVNPNSNDAPHKINLRVYEVGKTAKLVLDLPARGDVQTQLTSFVGSIKRDAMFPEHLKSDAGPAPPIRMVVRQVTNNRRQTLWFSRTSADRLGVEKHFGPLLATVSRHLASQGVQFPKSER